MGPPRITIIWLMDVFFPSKYKGYNMITAIRDWERGFQAIADVYEEVGGWDGMILPGYSIPTTPHIYSAVSPRNTIYPGAGLDADQPPQFVESEVLKREDYDDIINLGWNGFLLKRKTDFSPWDDERCVRWAKKQMERYKYEITISKSCWMRCSK